MAVIVYNKNTAVDEARIQVFKASPRGVVPVRVQSEQRKLIHGWNVKGMVEDTIPTQAPDKISLLRLDTDWYTSTKHEMQHLFPRLSRNGILIIDDYGHFKGAKQAVDEYLLAAEIPLMLIRIDYTGRIAIKIHG